MAHVAVMVDRALVRNAADPKQVGRADKREKDARDRELADVRAVLDTEPGRRFVWRVMARCRMFGSVFDPSEIRMAYNAGYQDVGHFLMLEIAEADDTRFLQMMEENQRRERQQNVTTDAHHTASTQEGQTDDYNRNDH